MDKSIIEDIDRLPEEDKLRMNIKLEQLQIRDSLRMYNSVVERCFNDCVDTSVRKDKLDNQETTCVRRCTEKFMKHFVRVGIKFGEISSAQATTKD